MSKTVDAWRAWAQDAPFDTLRMFEEHPELRGELESMEDGTRGTCRIEIRVPGRPPVNITLDPED